MSSVFYGGALRLSIFGQSHAPAIGMTLDGLPAGFAPDMAALARFLARRAPGSSPLSTPRKEADAPEFLCGLSDGRTCGAPLTAVIRNTNTRSQDYDTLRAVPRPGHADLTAQLKYGGHQDSSGGGHFSGRLTAPLCIAGGICLQMLAALGIDVAARIVSIADVCDETPFPPFDALRALDFPVADAAAGTRMREAILRARETGDSVGGVIECVVTGAPAGLGEPMFGGMENRLAQLLFAIPAIKGVEFGAGFAAARLRGSENNDPFAVKDGSVVTTTNHAGGILGGITTGMPIVLRAAFKPTPSIAMPQQSVDLTTMQPVELRVQGRHDPCVVPRAVPCVEAAAAIAVLDALLESRKTEDLSWN